MAPPWHIEHRSYIETNPHQSPARAFFYWIAEWPTLTREQAEIELLPFLGRIAGLSYG
jgi:hypothetical protein